MRYIRHSVGHYTVFHNGSHSFTSEHPAYQHLIDAMKADDIEKFLQYIDQRKAVFNWSKGNLKVVGEDLYFKDEILRGSLSQKAIEMIKDGKNCDSFLLFIEKIGENPSLQSINEFLTWLDHNSFIILENGNFLGYKSVRQVTAGDFKDQRGRNVTAGDFIDYWSSSFRNNIGDTNYMARSKVDPNKKKDCSNGFHISTLSYAKNFRGGVHIVLCEVHPKDVVSVPEDCSGQKVRVCRYKVHSKL